MKTRMDGSRGRGRREEFVCEKRVWEEDRACVKNLEARKLVQISVPKDTGGGLRNEA
jgi:hypothetical protein